MKHIWRSSMPTKRSSPLSTLTGISRLLPPDKDFGRCPRELRPLGTAGKPCSPPSRERAQPAPTGKTVQRLPGILTGLVFRHLSQTKVTSLTRSALSRKRLPGSLPCSQPFSPSFWPPAIHLPGARHQRPPPQLTNRLTRQKSGTTLN